MQKVENRISCPPRPAGRLAAVGFDGFIDILCRPIKQSRGENRYFSSLSDFGSFISSRAGKSGSLELEVITRKVGGNMPNLSLALKTLGADVRLVGSLGAPDAAFLEHFSAQELLSVCPPGECTALEFADGKLMLAQNGDVNSMDWALIKEKIGLSALKDLYSRADLAAFLNFSELPCSADVWKGLLREVFPFVGGGKFTFFDLCDPARREKEEITGVCEIISGFGRVSRAVVSLNENEADGLCAALSCRAQELRERLNAEFLAVHTRKNSLLYTETETFSLENRFVENPVISTGGGDNFNAGLSAALLSGFSPAQSLAAASLTSSFYISRGRSPSAEELFAFSQE